MNKELRRCPFCGGEAQINERYRSGIPNRKMYWISCKACGISQQNTNVSGYRYQSKAIDRWNRRDPMDKIVEQLEEKADEANDDWIAYGREDDYFDGKEDGIREAIEIVKGCAV